MKHERGRRVLAAALLAVCAYFSLEASLPPDRQPSAAAVVALIRGYQATGSPAMASMGVQCRYSPTCSHYAAAAFSHYGTMEGLVRTAGRLWRCSPWGGTGYDPAVATTSHGPIRQQETPEQKKAREDAQKALEEVKKAWQEAAPQAGKAAGACAIGCAGAIITGLISFGIWIVMIMYVLKDGKARGDANAVLWVVLVVFFHLIGFVIYFVARPKGDLTPCANCKNQRLQTLVKCPHCGADAAGAAKV
ncbi:MAG TPA: membrane protein insertion efficiency factor YidD [Planctomycetota bacterium]